MADQERSKIEDLPPTSIPNLDAVVPAMHDGQTVGLTVRQILSLATERIDEKVSKFGDTMTGPLTLVEDDIWKIRVGIGEFYIVDTSIAGVEIPPSTTIGATFIQLTAGLTGSGQYNEGKLTSESVSGTAPLVLATAVVNLSGSPINGKTIRLLNTEGRVLRPSTSSGSLQDDALQNITATITGLLTNDSPIASGAFTISNSSSANLTGGGGVRTASTLSLNASGSARTATETRMKNLGVTAFMRIK